jgi:hypothetical protein
MVHCIIDAVLHVLFAKKVGTSNDRRAFGLLAAKLGEHVSHLAGIELLQGFSIDIQKDATYSTATLSIV